MILLREDYTVKSLCRNCFDIVARQGSRIILVKAVEDANTLSKDVVFEMVKVADYLSAVPLIVADKAGFVLEKNIVYVRHGVYTLTLDTFENSVRNRMPFIRSSKAGATVQLDGDLLRRKREEIGLSLNELALKVGVSRKMVQKYETGTADITLQNAVKMFDALGTSVFKRIDLFSHQKVYFPVVVNKGLLSQKYSDLGFKAEEMKRSPFDVIAKKRKELILTSVGDRADPNAEKIRVLLDADMLMIYKNKKPKDVPSLKKKEFLEISKAKELIRFLKEF